MNKLEVGMYVRTKEGKIFKWNKLCTIDEEFYNEHTRAIYFDINEIKSSFNIIDLIEEKDLIEIEFYSPKYRKRLTRIFEVDYIIKDNICFENGHCQLNILNGEWCNADKQLKPIIKSVITHELFESIKYEVE